MLSLFKPGSPKTNTGPRSGSFAAASISFRRLAANFETPSTVPCFGGATRKRWSIAASSSSERSAAAAATALSPASTALDSRALSDPGKRSSSADRVFGVNLRIVVVDEDEEEKEEDTDDDGDDDDDDEDGGDDRAPPSSLAAARFP